MVDDTASPPSGRGDSALHPSGPSVDSSASPVSSSLFQRHRTAILATLSLFSLFGAVAAFAVVDESPLPTSRRIVEDLRMPDLNAQLEVLATRDDLFVSEQRIRTGDTLGNLLSRLGVSDADAEKFLRTSTDARVIRQLKPGRLVQAHVDDDGALAWLRYAYSATDGTEVSALARGHALVVERGSDGFVAHDETMANERRVELRAGEVRSSLFAATDAAGLPDGIATQIAEIFAGDIDFYRDLRRGDRFRVIYESFYQGGEFVRAGRILAVEFINGGKSHSALWFGGAGGADPANTTVGHYYGFDGRSLRRAFLRTPLEFTRISSGFGGRIHPISNVWRQHTGIDYAAPSGTPVRTTADGVVDFAGVKNGYGNCVIIKHQGVYSTLYGHLSAFASGLKRGQRVEQGRLVGYVGMTGWATGPHLHYEFRVSDHATNPLTAAMPEAPPIGRNELTAFRATATTFDRQIDLLRTMEGARVASALGSQRLAQVAVPGR